MVVVMWRLSRVKRTKPTPASRLRARGGGGGDVAVVVSEKNKKPPPPRMQARGGGTKQREPLRLTIEAREGGWQREGWGGNVDEMRYPPARVWSEGGGGGDDRCQIESSGAMCHVSPLAIAAN